MIVNRVLLSISSLQAIARTELHLTSHLVRTWVIFSIATLVTGYGLWAFAGFHTFSSSVSPNLGLLSPRYLSSYSGELLLIFEIGIILSISASRSRDIRDRIAEVIDSKPLSNLELLAGKLLGNIILLSMLALALVVLVFLASWILHLFEPRLGDFIDPYSVASFLVLDLVPNLALWGALAFFATLLLRSTLISCLVTVLAAVSFLFFTTFAPTHLLPAVANVTSAVIYPTDLAPQFANAMIVGHRIALIFATIGLLIFCSRFFPRRDGASKNLMIATGLCGILAGGFIVSALVLNVTVKHNELNRVSAVHRSLSNEPRSDILHIGGALVIRPGQNLEVDYEISIVSPPHSTEELIFAFNPGMELQSLRVDDEPIRYKFKDGLIYLSTNDMEPGQQFRLSLSAIGRLDTTFGYLDAQLNEYPADKVAGRTIKHLGVKKGVFHSKFVALTPGIKWYPTAGAAFGEFNYEHHPRDQFTVDLEVVVPHGWSIAGPGTGQILNTEGERTFRFAPEATLPEIGLFGARFIRRTMEIADVEFELLMSPKHTRNLELFADAVPLIKEQVKDTLMRARDIGIAYPYKTFTIVEVPNVLRIYGGDWPIDSIQALPGIFLMRESGFPTASFEQRLNSIRNAASESDDVPSLLHKSLEIYFENDLTGGNLLVESAQNFFNFRTYPTGRGAVALAYLTDALTCRLVGSEVGFYSFYVARDSFRFGYYVWDARRRRPAQGEAEQFANWSQMDNVNRPQIWDIISNTAPADLSLTGESEQSLHALILKGELLADLMVDTLGADEIGRLLSAIRSRHNGSSYTVADFNQIANELKIRIDSVLGNSLDDPSQPGFRAYEPKVVRLADDSTGSPVYQTTFYLTNEEHVPGHLKVRLVVDGQPQPMEESDETPVLRVEGNSYSQVALQSENPISRIHIYPYISLNRGWITLEVEQPNSWEPQDVDQLPLLSSVDWRPATGDSIIVDDLDDGFSVSGTGSRLTPRQRFWQRFNYYLRGEVPAQLDYDQGLPTAWAFGQLPEPQWYRYPLVSAWGKYRRTTTFVKVGVFGSVARFRALLPAEGVWQLEFHDPHGRGDFPVRSQLGPDPEPSLTFLLTINAADRSVPIPYDQATSSLGWNTIGEFSLPEGVVDVLLEHEGVNVHADAIRWSPVSSTN